MKKFFLLVCILFASLFCTACINSLAIQELNQMGADYLQNGDYDNAIARFKSSVDLDENVFESRYNLGVAYVQKEDYKNAINELEHALKIQPKSPDALYSYGVALESQGFSYEREIDDVDSENVSLEPPTQQEVTEGLKLIVSAIEQYEKFIKVASNKDEIQKVTDHIASLKKQISSACVEYKISEDELFSDMKVSE